MRSVTRASEKASYSRSNQGSFNDGNPEGASRRKWWRSCCCCVVVGMGVLLLLLFLVCLILWLVVKPTYPSLVMDNISLSSIKVSPERDGIVGIKALVSLNMTVHLTVENPNRVKLSFNPTVVNVTYKDAFLGNSTVPAFEEDPKSNRTMVAVLVVDRLNVLRGTGMSFLKDTATDAVPLTVIGQVQARVHVLGLLSPTIQVTVTCNVVVNPKEQTLGSKHCDINNAKL